MNVKSAMAVFDEAEAEMLGVVDSTDSRKVVGFLTETTARRRYVEDVDGEGEVAGECMSGSDHVAHRRLLSRQIIAN